MPESIEQTGLRRDEVDDIEGAGNPEEELGAGLVPGLETSVAVVQADLVEPIDEVSAPVISAKLQVDGEDDSAVIATTVSALFILIAILLSVYFFFRARKKKEQGEEQRPDQNEIERPGKEDKPSLAHLSDTISNLNNNAFTRPEETEVYADREPQENPIYLRD